MAPKEKWDFIAGFRVPGGSSGAAVRKACEIVLAQPGIRQTKLLEDAVKFSRLNFSTAGWITSPGPKSPATILWDRRKVDGVFCCFPNEFTPQCCGSLEAMIDVWKSMPINSDWELAQTLEIGDIAVKKSDGTPVTFHGWTHKHTKLPFSTLDEAARHLVSPEVFSISEWGVPPYPLWSVNGRFYDWGEHSVGTRYSDAPFKRA